MNNYESRGPKETAEYLCKNTMKAKADSDLLKLILLGILAGVYIGLGAEIATLATSDSAQFIGYGLSKLLAGAVFSVGLMLVIIAGAELFTGNILICMPVFSSISSVKKLFRNWGIVYTANLIGSLLLVLIIIGSGLAGQNNFLAGVNAVKIANAKVNLTFIEAFTRGILCNLLVCLAVWMAASAKTVSGKILAIFFPVMTFIACGFEHCIANMYFIPKAIVLKSMPEIISAGGAVFNELSNLTVKGFIFNNLIPVTLGNIIGAVIFVGGFYWITYLRVNKQNSEKFKNDLTTLTKNDEVLSKN